MRVPAQCLLNLQSEALHPATHIGPTDRQPDPHLARNRDHQTPSAFTLAAASVGGVVTGIRSRTLPATSNSITTGGASGTEAATGSSGTTTTSVRRHLRSGRWRHRTDAPPPPLWPRARMPRPVSGADPLHSNDDDAPPRQYVTWLMLSC